MAVKSDRTSRNLAALERSGSTSRVLNLLAVARVWGADAQYLAEPFFLDKTLNRCLVMKHRLRKDEYGQFEDMRRTATKIIIPFSSGDLKLGGRSVFVGQQGWVSMLKGVCNDTPDLKRDIQVLRCLDELPSLDPFLLREQLKSRNYLVAQCYFAISASDLAQMQSYVASQMQLLISMACQGAAGDNEGYAAKLVEALLSSEVDERLEPLRKTLNLHGEAYREGVFGWRGFLYYKWILTTLQPELVRIMDEMSALAITGPTDPETLQYISDARLRVQKNIVSELRFIAKALNVYDNAFRALTVQSNPQAFVLFLKQAPRMFIDLGERIGVASHIASFWRYRFPIGPRPEASIEDACDMFADFETGLGLEMAA